MTAEEKQEGQKTVVSFIAGLLIGGLLVWAFSGGAPEDQAPTDKDNNAAAVTGDTDASDSENADPANNTTITPVNQTPEMTIGDATVSVEDQSAGSVVTLNGATFPTAEGWIGVRTYTNGVIGSILGAARYSEEQGLVPEEIALLSPTNAGREYAIVFFSEDGNRNFNLDGDVQLETAITTFTAQ